MGWAAATRLALALFDDLLPWAIAFASAAIVVLLTPAIIAVLGFGAILALFGGLTGTPDGGGPVLGGPSTAIAVSQIPQDQLLLLHQVADAAPCQLPWTVLAAVANIESDFGKTADQTSSAGAYGYGQFLEGEWQKYGDNIPWKATDSKEQAKPVGERRDSTNFRYALPAMARYLCANGGGQDLRKAVFAYNRADRYVAAVFQLAARYGGIGAAGGKLIDGWADRPPLNQFDRRNYASDQSWISWRKFSCSAAALDWFLGAYGQQLATIEDAIAIIGPGTGISTGVGLLDHRGTALTSGLAAGGLNPREPRDGSNQPRALSSIAELKTWLDQGPLLMDGARWFGDGHWFVAIGYDSGGVYIRDSSGWDTRYLAWARLYGEVGFDGWVVGVAP